MQARAIIGALISETIGFMEKYLCVLFSSVMFVHNIFSGFMIETAQECCHKFSRIIFTLVYTWWNCFMPTDGRNNFNRQSTGMRTQDSGMFIGLFPVISYNWERDVVKLADVALIRVIVSQEYIPKQARIYERYPQNCKRKVALALSLHTASQLEYEKGFYGYCTFRWALSFSPHLWHQARMG